MVSGGRRISFGIVLDDLAVSLVFFVVVCVLSVVLDVCCGRVVVVGRCLVVALFAVECVLPVVVE
jgi:hypothetical protein